MTLPALEIPRLMDLPTALERRAALRAEGQTLAITNGCFDLLHAGHVFYLEQAAQQADVFWLLLNSDASVRALKGPARPIQNEQHRAYVLSALHFIDGVIIFASPRLDNEIRALRPDVYVKAEDYNVDTINADEKAALLEVGADIRFMPFLQGFSSTDLMNKIKNA